MFLLIVGYGACILPILMVTWVWVFCFRVHLPKEQCLEILCFHEDLSILFTFFISVFATTSSSSSSTWKRDWPRRRRRRRWFGERKRRRRGRMRRDGGEPQRIEVYTRYSFTDFSIFDEIFITLVDQHMYVKPLHSVALLPWCMYCDGIYELSCESSLWIMCELNCETDQIMKLVELWIELTSYWRADC